MPRILRRHIYVKLFLLVSLLLLLVILPGTQDSLWNSFRSNAKTAATFTVNSTGDGADSNPGDGVCNDGTGACTLRAAINQANANASADVINFNLPANSIITLNNTLDLITDDLNINGPGANTLTIQRSTTGGTPRFGVFAITNQNQAITVNISGLTISNGHTVDGANAGGGGGVSNDLGATANLTNMVIKGNATGNGMPGSGGFGGGIFNFGTMTITNSTISGNTTGTGGSDPGAFGGYGGGIYNAGTLALTNTTVSENNTGNSNSLVQGGFGGGIFNSIGSTLTLINSTVSGNQAASGGFGGGIRNDGTASIKDTIIANNTVSGVGLGADLSGSFDSQDYNLIEDTSDASFTGTTTHNIIGVDPLLGPLAANGGPTFTHALQVGGPAIDAGNSALTTDQRGQPRPVDDQTVANAAGGNASDIGAYEAHTFEVNSTADSDDGLCTAIGTGNGCTLREAINAANAQAGAELITFAPALTSGGPATVSLLTVLPAMSSDMIVAGPGANLLTVERSDVAATKFRIFTINSGKTVSISGLTVTRGSTADGADAPAGGMSGANGGGILNLGTLSLTGMVITGNRTGNGGNATNPGFTLGGPGGSGGGISSSGSLTMTNVTVSNNLTGNGGNAGHGGHGGLGGGVHVSGTMTMTNSPVTGNNTGIGGVGSEAGASGGAGGLGGGMYVEANGTFTMTNITVTGNNTGDGAGVSGAGGHGGGIAYDSFVLPTGSASLINSTVSNNTTGDASPGVAGQAGFGGGIFSVGTLTVIGSAITGNATGFNGPGGGGVGGGIDNSGTLTMTNTTVSGNSTGAEGGTGAGLWNARTATLTNCTIVFNSSFATFGGAGIHQFNSSSVVNISNTIVAGNSLSGSPNGPDVDTGFAYNSQGNNLIANAEGSSGFNQPGDQVGTSAAPINPRLAPLAINGGPTQTHALLISSPALDAGNNASLPADTLDLDGDTNTGEPIPFDQRGTGFARVVDGPDADTTDTVDIGAFEAQVSVADIADQTINEDGSLSLPFSVGGAASITGVTATSSNTTLVPNDPANISLSGSGSSRTLQINPVANASGTSTITVTVNGDNSQTMTDTFLLTVNSVNDAPSFTKGPNPTVNENSGGQTINNWATNIFSGPTNESGQTLTFIVTNNSNPALFAVAPAIGSTGTLTYTPATNVSGTALITIALMDNGGAANGGTDTSATQSFNINVLEGGTLAFSAATFSVAEGGGSAAITVTRSGGSAGTATVLFATSNGTATAADYTSISQTITFNNGETSKTVNVAITDDLFKESDETVNLTLSNAGGSGQLGVQTTAVLTIIDNDPLGGYIRFSSANFNTTESSGSTTITVERIGDTTQSVSVFYFTAPGSLMPSPCELANGIASPRCDFTTALGTLRFAAGETTKTFLVLISQDNYVEGPETLTLGLSNPTAGAALGTPSAATLTIADDATEPAANPIDDAETFVRQHYHDFLNREPDAGGLAFWTNQITECQKPGATCNAEVRRINVSAAFFLSIEFQETGYLVERLYKSAYGDAVGISNFGPTHQLPVPVVRLIEFLPDTQQIGKGVVIGKPGAEQLLENNKVAFTQDFVSRSRFITAYPTTMTPAQFVDALFTNTGVTPSDAERTSIINEFGGAGNTIDTVARARALRRVAENSTVTQQESNKAFVLMQYFGYLRRNPNDPPDADYSGYDFWLTKLNEFNGNFVNAEMVKAFIISGEYRQRFGP